MKMLLISFANSRNGSRVIITTRNDNMSLDSGPMHFGHLESCRLSKEEGREQSKLVAQLIPDADESSELRVISVLGERATGKTALVESVYDQGEIQCHFNRHAWVRVFADSGLEDILSDVLRQPTMSKLEEVDCQREQHLSEIFQKTFKEQRFLVVLDNLQSVDLMKMLLISFGDSRNGSRVMITTSNEKMSLDSRHIHFSHLKLCRLSEEESHSLLGKSGWTRDPELTKAILDKCNGYPPVIQLLGGLPSTVEVPNYCTLTEIISLSYDSLLTFSRHCLLYLVLFPRESEIPVRRLFNIWLAEKPSSSGDCTEDPLDALVARNMVHVVTRKLDGSAKTCLMPGFLHDFMSEMVMDVGTSEISHNSISTSSRPPRMSPIAVKIYPSATGEQEMMVSTNTSTKPRGARRANMSSLSLHSTKHLSRSPPKLQYIAIKMDVENRQCKQMWISHDAKTQYVDKFFRSFMLFNTWKHWEHVKETEMFLEPLRLRGCFPWLKVLDLEHVYKPTLPKRLDRIMPKLCSILKVRSLQHLYMNEVCLDRSIFYNASSRKSLANLKTLWGLRIERKNAMLSVLGKFTGLRKLGLTCHCMVTSDAAKSVARLTNLQSLSQQQSLSNLHLIGALTLQDLQCLPRNLQILTLSMTQLGEDEMEVLKKLAGLTSLRLLAGSYKCQSMTCADGAFPALRVLKLWKLELLEKWTIEKGALPRLQELEIRDCTRLIHIFGLIHVEGLQEINLTNLEKEVVMTVEGMRLKAVVIVRELAVPPLQDTATLTMRKITKMVMILVSKEFWRTCPKTCWNTCRKILPDCDCALNQLGIRLRLGLICRIHYFHLYIHLVLYLQSRVH
ncbi:hypothetical protein EUGRSUZ_L00232 [Eucalyptus grandis]|uniref:Uncharacterized protein n=1 Tax=Eucalyptus grandis TaxID=71139 RepID=A0A058ZY04_EUCGR|nr:hypothetical protein EUGRSUZ_L00232 [Eucalyptus grandis]